MGEDLETYIEEQGLGEYKEEIMEHEDTLVGAASRAEFKDPGAALAAAYRATTGDRFDDVAEKFGIDDAENPGEKTRNVCKSVGFDEKFDEPVHVRERRSRGSNDDITSTVFQSPQGVTIDVSKQHPEGVGEESMKNYSTLAEHVLERGREEDGLVSQDYVMKAAMEEYGGMQHSNLNKAAQMTGEITRSAENVVPLGEGQYAMLPPGVDLGADEFSIYNSRANEEASVGDLSESLHRELEGTLDREAVGQIFDDLQKRAAEEGSVEANELKDSVSTTLGA